MPRLRLTTALSLVMLLSGIAGTAWLSTPGVDWPRAKLRVASSPPLAAVQKATAERAPRVTPIITAKVGPHESHAVARPVLMRAAVANPPAELPVLRPLSMPSESLPWRAMRDHLDGELRVALDIDGTGRVMEARIAESSGDAVLDAHALHSVRLWRFAVPDDQPAGIRGEWPMRFTSRDQGVARAQ